MAELVDALASGASVFGCKGSNPFSGTKGRYKEFFKSWTYELVKNTTSEDVVFFTLINLV